MPPLRRGVRGFAVATAGVVALGWLPLAGPAVAATEGPVVVVGVQGLRWTDLSEEMTPELWDLAADASLGSMSIRATTRSTCPVAGWLTLGAGQRAAEEAPDPGARCTAVPQPRAASAGADVPRFDDLRRLNADGRYSADLGLLGETLARAGGCVTAVGPGAALAAADPSGSLSSYVPADAELFPELFDQCQATLVDAGSVAGEEISDEDDAAPSAAALRVVDDRVGQVVDAVPAAATVLVIGLADRTTTPHLTVALARGPAPDGEYDDGWLATRSTRRDGLVQLTDVLPTVTALLGVETPSAAIGSPLQPDGPRPGLSEAVETLVEADTKAHVASRFTPHFFTLLVVSQLLLYGAAAFALRRREGGAARRQRVMRVLRRTALVFAAVPVSTYLANLVPWWRSGRPLLGLTLALVVAVLLVTSVAQLGPWRRRLLGPFGVVAGLTGLVLLVDVVTGSTLQLSSLMGYSPLVAGRFYGFGNLAFSLFATGTLLAATALADLLVHQGRRTAAVAAVALVGVVAVVVDGWPRWGTDVGGVLALVPAFAVLALLVAQVRISWWRAVVVGAAAVLTLGVIAYVDWRNPAGDRSHLGRFVQQVLDGEAATVIQRKLEANLRAFRNYLLALLVPIGFAFVVLVLMRPGASRAAALARAYDRSPTLRSGVIAVMVALGIGFAVNDSGIAIPAVALFVAIPLILAASVRALELDAAEGGHVPPAPPP